MEYRLVKYSVDVKKGTGIEGFLRVVKEILRLSRVQTVTIESKGTVEYERYVLEADPDQPIEVAYDDLEPYNVIRNSTMDDVEYLSSNPAVALALLLDRSAKDQLHPCVFVTGANSNLSTWFAHGTGRSLSSASYLCGLPVLLDRQIPDSALILGSAYSRDSGISGVQKFYKMEMEVAPMPETTVEVFSWTGQ